MSYDTAECCRKIATAALSTRSKLKPNVARAGRASEVHLPALRRRQRAKKWRSNCTAPMQSSCRVMHRRAVDGQAEAVHIKVLLLNTFQIGSAHAPRDCDTQPRHGASRPTTVPGTAGAVLVRTPQLLRESARSNRNGIASSDQQASGSKQRRIPESSAESYGPIKGPQHSCKRL